MTLLNQSRKICVFLRHQPPPHPLPSLQPQKWKVFWRRKSHLTTTVIFSRPRGATMEEGKRQIFFLIATIISLLSRNTSGR